MNRRELLGALGTLGATAALCGPVELTRRTVLRGLQAEPTDRDVLDWEITAETYGREVGVVVPDRLLGQVVADLGEVAHVLDRSLSEATRSRMLRVAGRLSAVSAVSLVATGEFAAGRRWWRTVRQAAEQAGDGELEVFALGQQAMLALYGGHTQEQVVSLADHAIAVGDGRACAGTASAWATRAQALARWGRLQEARAALDEVWDLFARLSGAVGAGQDSWFGYPEHKLRHTESYVHTWLGDTRRAWTAQDRVLALCPADNYRGRAQVHLHRALCLLQDGEVAEGLAHAVATVTALPRAARSDRFVQDVALSVLEAVPGAVHEVPGDDVAQLRTLVGPRALPSGRSSGGDVPGDGDPACGRTGGG